MGAEQASRGPGGGCEIGQRDRTREQAVQESAQDSSFCGSGAWLSCCTGGLGEGWVALLCHLTFERQLLTRFDKWPAEGAKTFVQGANEALK